MHINTKPLPHDAPQHTRYMWLSSSKSSTHVAYEDNERSGEDERRDDESIEEMMRDETDAMIREAAEMGENDEERR